MGERIDPDRLPVLFTWNIGGTPEQVQEGHGLGARISFRTMGFVTIETWGALVLSSASKELLDLMHEHVRLMPKGMHEFEQMQVMVRRRLPGFVEPTSEAL